MWPGDGWFFTSRTRSRYPLMFLPTGASRMVGVNFSPPTLPFTHLISLSQASSLLLTSLRHRFSVCSTTRATSMTFSVSVSSEFYCTLVASAHRKRTIQKMCLSLSYILPRTIPTFPIAPLRLFNPFILDPLVTHHVHCFSPRSLVSFIRRLRRLAW